MKKLLVFMSALLSCYLSVAQVHYSFSSSSGTYNSLSGGTTAPLVAAYPSIKTLLDESFANNIPIGFVFQYNGINYSSIHLNANGFASLGSPFLSSATINPSYELNDLRAGNGYKATSRPFLAPFWDNLLLNSASDITYKTENAAPNRVFTAQWNNCIWQSGAGAISFQIKLYETTNVIDFVYKPEADAGGANKSASIGITSEKSRKTLFDLDSMSFVSLNSTTASPLISTLSETDDISTKPASGQIYKFTPIACMPPSGIKLSSCSTSEANITWTALQGATSYQYALSNVDVEPFTGTNSALTALNFKNLSPGTVYYFYIKSTCGTVWNKLKFKTSSIVTLPYIEDFESTLENQLPEKMSSQELSNDFADIFWQTTNLLPGAGSSSKAAVNGSPFTTAKTWLYTAAFNLVANNQYNLTFKCSTTGATNALEVKYGTMTGEDMMANVIFANDAIVNTSYETKSFNFTPTTSGEYVIGFKYKSAVNNDLFLIDDIEVKATGVLPVGLTLFTAKLVNNKEVKLDWQTKSETNASHFNIERSVDGEKFEKIGEVKCTGGNVETNYQFYDRNPLSDVSYYRLNQVDKDYKTYPSHIETIKMKSYFAMDLYPNPSAKDVFLRIEKADGVNIKVFSLTGQEIAINKQIINKNEIKISPTQTLPSGIYMVNVSSKTETRVLKWVVL